MIVKSGKLSTNWIFRLSIDDRKAGPFLVRRLVKRYRCASPTLLLLDSGWGRANFDSMQREFPRLGPPAPKVVFFPASVDTALSDQIAKDIRRSGSDCLVLLANAIEGARLINSIYRERNDIRIVSHWGILTGDFSGAVPHVVRQALKIEILQTCGLWVAQMYPERVARILKTAKLGDKGVKKLSEIDASTGFVHGYDLTLLLIAAIDQGQSTQDWAGMDISAKRDAVRAALEDLRTPVEGLLKTYRTPFKPYSQAAPDSHEALGADDLSMVEFSQAGTIANSNN